ncbi:hypothetical protein AURDEDRAFT_154600 [Auricularia subglabra TFB-10046 SS5]|uniref:Uncharacterized protein n=1 Tax=Auricularia subglabra (strain TFB-10046 / SS5) TaxID=717982 RepID=J0LGD2_AURST|nr:hypothetical protein AURDEDRAFT_154600 [Auricularia subglabra TFB-10046 SS5]
MAPLSRIGLCLVAAVASAFAAPVYSVLAARGPGAATVASPVIRWVAVGIAAVLAILQGVIAALTAQCSASRWWTVRFWILRNEHLYWTVVVLFLCASVGLNVAFIIQSGSDESTSLLVTAATIGVVTYQYLITSWSQARFRHAWWLAWTGRSRTRIQDALAVWLQVDEEDALSRAARVIPSPIERGAVVLGAWNARRKQVLADPTDILRAFAKAPLRPLSAKEVPPYAASTTFGQTFPDLALDGVKHVIPGVSLLWGGEGSFFARRVSRAIESIDGDMWARIAAGDGSYIMRWAALSHGILGRNKGLAPHLLVAIGLDGPGQLTVFEEHSSLGPRPAKTKRSFVKEHMASIYGGLTAEFRLLATELALLLEDVGPSRIEDWLKQDCEHQDWQLSCSQRDSPATGRVLYRLSYLAMVASLNFGRRDDHVPYLRPEAMIASALGGRLEEGWLPPTSPQWLSRIAREERANPGCREWLTRVQLDAVVPTNASTDTCKEPTMADAGFVLSGIPVSWALEGPGACACVLLLSLNAFTVNTGWWTLRFHVFRHEHLLWSAIELALLLSFTLSSSSLAHRGILTAAIIAVAYFALIPAWSDAFFRRVFWKAWTGRSRTRIQSPIAPGLNASPDAVARAANVAALSPSERGLLLTEFSRGIVADPTAILRVLSGEAGRMTTAAPAGTATALGFVYPTLTTSGGFELRGTSLLWGPPHYKRRVSRAVIAVDGDMWARIARGGSAAYVLSWAAVAHGILGRNKGLNPTALSACGLDGAGALARFEHASALGTRSAKTKRSIVREHMLHMYGALGEAYVLMAAELALLIEDAGPARVAHWLDAECEQQDPTIALVVPEALRGVHYRLHYVTMLASLNFGSGCHCLRPELIILKHLGGRLLEHEVSWSWMEKQHERLDAERRENPGCEPWLKEIESFSARQ